MTNLLAKILLASLLGVACIGTPVHAATIEVGVQWTLNAGFNVQWSGVSGGGCGAVNNGGNNCTMIPAGTTLRQCTGSQTAKNGGIEILVRVLAGTAVSNETIWQAENWGQSTIVVNTPALAASDPQLSGGNNVWIEFQANSPANGTGLEVQITCSAY